MEYQIFCNEDLIADFKYEADRDICMDALRDIHPDATFTTVEDPSTIKED